MSICLREATYAPVSARADSKPVQRNDEALTDRVRLHQGEWQGSAHAPNTLAIKCENVHIIINEQKSCTVLMELHFQS